MSEREHVRRNRKRPNFRHRMPNSSLRATSEAAFWSGQEYGRGRDAATIAKNDHVGTRKSLLSRRAGWEANRRDSGLMTHRFTQELGRRWPPGASPSDLQIALREAEGLHGCRGTEIQNRRQLDLREIGGEGLSQWPDVTLLFRRGGSLVLSEVNTPHAGGVEAIGTPGHEKIIHGAGANQRREGHSANQSSRQISSRR